MWPRLNCVWGCPAPRGMVCPGRLAQVGGRAVLSVTATWKQLCEQLASDSPTLAGPPHFAVLTFSRAGTLWHAASGDAPQAHCTLQPCGWQRTGSAPGSMHANRGVGRLPCAITDWPGLLPHDEAAAALTPEPSFDSKAPSWTAAVSPIHEVHHATGCRKAWPTAALACQKPGQPGSLLQLPVCAPAIAPYPAGTWLLKGPSFSCTLS